MVNQDKKNIKKDEAKSAKKPSLVKEEKPKKLVLEVKAAARYVRVAPRKVRLVIDALKGKTAEDALDVLRFIHKSAVRPVTKLINSAIANATHNFNLDKKNLFIKKITANEGPAFDRWQPKAYGRAGRIRKRTSHIELILGVKNQPTQKPAAQQRQGGKKEKEEVKVFGPQDVRKQALKIAGQGTEKDQEKTKK